MVIAHSRAVATAVPWRTGLIGLIGFGIGILLTTHLRSWPSIALLALLSCTAMPMWWIESRRYSCVSVGTDSINNVTRQSRQKWRLRGLLIAAPVWAIALNILPLAGSAPVSGFWAAMMVLWPVLFAGLLLYVWRPPSGNIHGIELAGRWLTDRQASEAFPWHVLRDQAVKAFFLPMMVSFAYTWVDQADPWSASNALYTYTSLIALLYLVDTTYAAIGYLSTVRPLDAHIRSSNPYWLGWIAALICYPPFFNWLQNAGFNYRDGYQWLHWLKPDSLLFHAWGGAILILTAIYALSTVVFGIRFSNLTHRGIITHGPYRFTKHPAYISKNLSWWLISVPFISSAGTGFAILHCCILSCINGIYWLRAKTEERHLMHDPKYREYAAWIAEHGVLARLSSLFSAR